MSLPPPIPSLMMVDPSSVHMTVVPSTRMPYRKTLASLPAEGSDLLCVGDFSTILWPEHHSMSCPREVSYVFTGIFIFNQVIERKI